jgi:hypothetical protein
LRAQEFCAPAVRTDDLALERKTLQAFSPGLRAIERDQDRMCAGNRLGLEITVSTANAHAPL